MSDLAQARADLARTRLLLASAKNNARVAALEAAAAGTSESEIARELGVTRVTVRKWLGK